jgi:hypothetical protein
MTFDEWWVSEVGHPPLPEEMAAFELAHKAWEAKESETLAVYRIRLTGALRERDEAVGKAQRHEELRKQAEGQCVRFQRRGGVLVALVESFVTSFDRARKAERAFLTEAFCTSARKVLG